MKARSALVYTALRLLAFLVPFGILMLFPVMRQYYWLAAIFAALIGLSLSLLFLRKPLDEVSAGLARAPSTGQGRRERRAHRGFRGGRGYPDRATDQPTKAQKRKAPYATDVSDVRPSATTSSRGSR